MVEGNFKDLLIRHVEKFALGVVLLIIIIYLISLAVGTTEARKLKGKANSALERIRDNMENPALPEDVNVSYAHDVQTPYKEVPEPGREPRWFPFKRPYIIRKAKFEDPTQSVHRPPTLSATADIGQVKLSWKEAQDNRNIDVLGYTLRRREGEGNWLKLKSFDVEARDYVDKTVRPITKYAYRITSHAKEKDPRVPLKNSDEPSKTALVETPFNMEFDTEHMMPHENKVRIKITYRKSGTEEVTEWVWIEKGKNIKVKDIETDWKLKSFGERKLGPAKVVKYIVIVNSKGKEMTIPPTEGTQPEGGEKPEEPEKPPEEPEKPEDPEKKTPEEPEDPGGGWLPPGK